MGILLAVLFVLAGAGLPYCLLHAAKALRDKDDDLVGMFTLGSCLCGGYLALFICLAILNIL